MALMTRQLKVIAVVATALTTAAIGLAVFVSLDPNYYFFYRMEDRAAWTYDLANVALFGTIMLLAAAIATAALVAPRPRLLAIRGILALLLLVPWAMYLTPYVIHLHGYIVVHHLWVWLLIVILVVASIGSFTRFLILAIRAKRASAI